jgi:hypothetical protein
MSILPLNYFILAGLVVHIIIGGLSMTGIQGIMSTQEMPSTGTF